MTQLKGFLNKEKIHIVYKLKKVLYRLKQALRTWFIKLNNCLMKWCFKCSKLDISMLFNTNANMIVFLISMDDIVVTISDSQLIQSMIDKLHATFTLND